MVMLWRERVASSGSTFGEPRRPGAPAGAPPTTQWKPVAVLRGHCADVVDLCWSPQGDSLFTGCMDGTTIVWNIAKAKPAQILQECARTLSCSAHVHKACHALRMTRSLDRPSLANRHEGYVQGVAWDPLDDFLVSMSCDRTARIYSGAAAGQKRSSKKAKELAAAKEAANKEDRSQRMFNCQTVLAKKTQSLTPAEGTSADVPPIALNAVTADTSSKPDEVPPTPPPAAGASPTLSASAVPVSPQDVGKCTCTTPEDVAAEHALIATAVASGGNAATVGDGCAVASKGKEKEGIKTAKLHLFLDENVGSFYRRPCWSPDGSFLLLPCGQYQTGTQSGPTRPTTHVLARGNLGTPCAHLPSPDKPVIAVRFCPVLFERRVASGSAEGATAPATSLGPQGAVAPTGTAAGTGDEAANEFASLAASPDTMANTAASHSGRSSDASRTKGASSTEWMHDLPYRVVWAVATLDSIILYDSMLRQPLLVACNVHYAALTDIAWLPSGAGLIVSSIDGYCTLIRIAPGALGTPLAKDQVPVCMRPKSATSAPSTIAPAATVAPPPGPVETTPARSPGAAEAADLRVPSCTAPSVASAAAPPSEGTQPCLAIPMAATKDGPTALLAPIVQTTVPQTHPLASGPDESVARPPSVAPGLTAPSAGGASTLAGASVNAMAVDSRPLGHAPPAKKPRKIQPTFVSTL